MRLGRRHTVALSADAAAWVDVLDLLERRRASCSRRHGRWYIAGRDPRWLRRNALVVLGNVGDGRRSRTVERPRPLPPRRRDRSRARRWAARRLGLARLADRDRDDPSASVSSPSASARVGADEAPVVTNDFPPKIGGIQS